MLFADAQPLFRFLYGGGYRQAKHFLEKRRGIFFEKTDGQLPVTLQQFREIRRMVCNEMDETSETIVL